MMKDGLFKRDTEEISPYGEIYVRTLFIYAAGLCRCMKKRKKYGSADDQTMI